MSARAILAELRSHGVTVALEGGTVRLRPPSGRRLPADLIERARAVKADLVAALSAPDTASDVDDFEERAAVAEFDGGLSRPHAECLAALQTMARPPDVSDRQMAGIVDLAARRLQRPILPTEDD